jgi:hypothetical protein
MYMPLVAKIVEENPFLITIEVNFKLFCFMPMLKIICALNKFA